MIKKLIKTSMLSTLLLAGLITSVPTFAGADLNVPGNCILAGTTYTCTGTLSGIRTQTADPASYVIFSQQVSSYKDSLGNTFSWTTPIFMMYVNNVFYACFPPQSYVDIWNVAASSPGYFSIQFDSNFGTCTALALSSGSGYKGVNAL